MCGIAGFVDGSKRVDAPESNQVLKNMMDLLSHRGPDAEGQWHAEGVALGHRRLSIIDLDGGAQPMTSEDGSLALVQNGEIYIGAAADTPAARRMLAWSEAALAPAMQGALLDVPGEKSLTTTRQWKGIELALAFHSSPGPEPTSRMCASWGKASWLNTHLIQPLGFVLKSICRRARADRFLESLY